MDLSGVRQQILSSNKTASAKAELFLLERKVDELSLDEWRELIAMIPEDVEEEIGRLMSGGGDKSSPAIIQALRDELQLFTSGAGDYESFDFSQYVDKTQDT